MALLGVLLSGVWLVLMLRACQAEYRYYACVASEAPDVWQQLGAPPAPVGALPVLAEAVG